MRRVLLLLAAAAGLYGQQTIVADTLHNASGALVSGGITISWNTPFTTTGGVFVAAGRISVPVKNGAFSVQLYPTDTSCSGPIPLNPGCTPTHDLSYSVTYSLPNYVRGPETWTVPTGGPFTIQFVVTNTPPIPQPPPTLFLPSQISGVGALNTSYVLGWSGSSTYWRLNPAGAWGTLTGLLSNQTDLQAALNAKQNLLGFTPENVANKDIASGYAGLDSGGKLKTSEAPTWNQSTTGNAATSTAFASSPTICPSGQGAQGVNTGGNAVGCTPFGSGGGSTTPLTFTAQTSNTFSTLSSVGASISCATSGGTWVVPASITNPNTTTPTVTFDAAFTGTCWAATGGASAVSLTFSSQTSNTFSTLGSVGAAISCVNGSGALVIPAAVTNLNTTTPTVAFDASFTGTCYAVI